MPEEEKINLADYIIQNDGLHALIPQVWAIHHSIATKNALPFH
jgi:dephospho-CoA kinase